MSEDLNVGEATAELLKELVGEMRTLRERVESLERRNTTLVKAMDDPEAMMRKAGWLRAMTPVADEVYDPLQRDNVDSFTTAFDHESIVKSHDNRLDEWKEMEKAMPQTKTPAAIKYR